MNDLAVEDRSAEAVATLTDLERLQDQVLAELDALAHRIEQVLKEFGRSTPKVANGGEPGPTQTIDVPPNAGIGDLEE